MRYHRFVYFILFYTYIKKKKKKNRKKRHGTDTVELLTDRRKKKRGEIRTFPPFFQNFFTFFFICCCFFLWCDTNLINYLDRIYFSLFSKWKENVKKKTTQPNQRPMVIQHRRRQKTFIPVSHFHSFIRTWWLATFWFVC